MTPKERAAMQQALIYLDAIINGEGVKPYQLEGTAFTLREALDHSGEANEMVGCAYCNNPLFAGTKCNNCGFITLAEQAKPTREGKYYYKDNACTADNADSPDCICWHDEALAEQAEQEQNSTFMEGYRIGLAEMREKCATVSEQGTGEAVQKAALELLLNERKRIAAAIRAIKFEGDTGFRPVAEMLTEHKQDPKKAAAIEKAKMRKATRAEKIAMSGVYEVPVEQAEQKQAELKECRHCGFLCKPNQNESKKFYPLEQPVAQEPEPELKFPLQLNNDEIIKSVKNSLNIYSFTAEALETLIDNAKKEDRGALGENNGKRNIGGNSEYNVAGGNDDCSCIGNDQEPVIDLSKLRHEDKCCYWDDEKFCDCGADDYALLQWYRKNVAHVRTKDLTDDEILDVALSIEIEFSKDTDKFVQQLEDIEVFARAVIAADREKNK